MMSEAIIHGIILAFGLIIPLGVQNVFVFNQGASQPNIWRRPCRINCLYM